MFSYSQKSQEKLDQCHKDIQEIMKIVIMNYDCTITEGSRSEELQNEYFRTGKSKLKYPESQHNITESRPKSMAVDAIPYPVDYDDLDRFFYFGGYVKAVADMLFTQGIISHKLIWGRDWNGNNNFNDQSFNDFPHFELVEA